VIKFPLELTY